MKTLYERALSMNGRLFLNPAYFAWLRGATQYEFRDSITQLALHLGSDDREVTPLVPFLKLPSQIAFFEWRDSGMVAGLSALGHPPPMGEGVLRYDRWGCLLMKPEVLGLEVEDGSEQIIIQPVIDHSLPEYGTVIMPTSTAYAFSSEPFEETNWAKTSEFSGKIAKDRTEWGRHVLRIHSPCWPRGTEGDEFKPPCTDIIVAMWPTLLALMSTPNLVQVSPRSRAGISRRRSSVATPIDCRNYRVSMQLSKVQGRRVSGGGGEQVRLHTVRGHFKVRKTGIFWWSDHWAGNANKGSTTKTYTLSV